LAITRGSRPTLVGDVNEFRLSWGFEFRVRDPHLRDDDASVYAADFDGSDSLSALLQGFVADQF